MDAGAHFHRCDFQVHTPRDINWTGPRPTSEEDRAAWADRFVAKCRELGLQAVAITDHHDMTFVEPIRQAARRERDPDGDLVSPEARLVVFPGMELTLAVPCQALLLLDSDFPANLLLGVAAALGITGNDPNEPQHAQTGRLEHFDSLHKIFERLDALDYALGRYIVLPNVGKGESSIMRQAFAPKYKDMPCVGGYLDGSLTALDDGHKRKLDGKIAEWGHRAIGVFQTSDDRHDDRRNLGTHSTWVKWAEPTAEGLRQACLARQTRLHQTEPQLPAITITSLEISNSTFLGPIDLELNPQFTCLIGGRGTGKSSILEYLRWALCDHPPQTDSAELPDYQKKRVGLVKNTLAKVDGIVTVTFSLNGIQHIVQRKAKEDTIQLKIADGEFEDRPAADIEKLLPIQAYSQKQLSAVGVRTEELVRLIESPVETKLSALWDKSRDAQERIRKAYGRLRAVRELTIRVEQQKVEESSLALQVAELRKQLTGLSNEDRAILAQHERVLTEEQYVEQLARNLTTTRSAIEELAGSMIEPPAPPTSDDPEESLPHADALAELSTAARVIHSTISQSLSELVELLADGGDAKKDFVAAEKVVRDAIAEHNKAYEEAKARSTAHAGKLKLIEELEQRIKTVRQAIAETEEELRTLGEPETEYVALTTEWKQTYVDRAQLLQEECVRLTELSDSRIRATLKAAADTARLQERLSAELAGTRVRGTAIEALCSGIANADDPVAEWAKVARELESLAIIDANEDDDVTVPACPRLVKAGVTQNDLERIARKLKPTTWLELSLVQLDDVPVFEYQRRENDYIPFASASAGQQATALLQVLLNQEGPPLIIDQPEDDLDNQVVFDIVEQLWTARSRRQIIVSSHNANLVVNGDADLVVCCDYRRSGDHSGGQIKHRGAIDIEEIREEIKRVMEGGERAFQLRKAKYGF